MFQLKTPNELRLYAQFIHDLADIRDGDAEITVEKVETVPVDTALRDLADKIPAPAVDKTEPAENTEELDGDAPILDVNGLPWDGRIHASSRKTNADGTWRAKRGVSSDLVASVTAELKGEDEQPVQMETPVVNAPGDVAIPQPPAGLDITPPVVEPAAPAAPAAPAEPVTWPQVCEVMQQAMARGVDYARINEVARDHGLQAFALGSSRPDLHAILFADLKAL